MASEILSNYHNKDNSGSHPDFDGEQLTIYGTIFCPFVRRVLITLDVKQIPHNLIGIDLLNKPDWYLEVNPTGRVPYLKEGNKQLTESLVIVDYLDSFSCPSIHPTDPYIKAKGSLLVEELFPLGLTAIRNLKDKGSTIDHKIAEIKKALSKLETKLQTIKTKYLQSDNKPYYADYMIYPALEMIIPVLQTLNSPSFNSEHHLASSYPSLANYLETMASNQTIKRVCPSKQVHADYFSMVLKHFN